MEHFARLRWRLSLWLSAAVALALALALASAYLIVRERTLQRGGEALAERQQVIARGIGEVFAGVERRSRELAMQIAQVRPSPQQLAELLTARVLNDSETASLGVLLEPDNPMRPGQRVAIVVTYGSSGIVVTDFVATGYDYWNKDWYRRTLGERTGWWSDPYFNDAAGGQDTATYDYPLIDAEGRAFGMIGVSVTLDRVAEIAAALGLRRDQAVDRYLLADRQGKLLMVSEPGLERAYTLTQAVQREGRPALAWMAAVAPGAPPRQVRLDDPLGGGEVLAYASVPLVDWRLASVASDRRLLESLHATLARIGLLVVLLVAALVLLLYAASGRLTRPLARLAQVAERLAAGEFATPAAAAPAGDALAGIDAALERARQRLCVQGERLAEAERAQQQSQHALALAAHLQSRLWPPDRVLFGPQLQCESVARVRPAASVAGDLHGVVSPRPGLGLYYLADVSGAGDEAIAAMTRLGAQLPLLLRQPGEVDELLARLAGLWQDAGLGGQVSVLLLRIDLGNGELQLANAGAPAPWLRRADGSQSLLALDAAPALGAGEGWAIWHGRLAAGDRLLAVSDGVLRQRNGRGEFGGERVQIALESLADQRSQEVPGALIEQVLDFAGRDTPDDDLAVLHLSLQHRD